MAKYPKAKWVEYEPLNEDESLAGTELAFGDRLRPQYDLSKADVVVSLDCDFLQLDNPGLNVIREFARRRKAVDTMVPAGHAGGEHKAPAHGEGHKAEHKESAPPPVAAA